MKQFKSFAVYGFTTFFNAGISFATFAILTHYLSEVDYGIINLYNSFIVLLTPFISVGVPFLLNVDYFKMQGDAYQEQFTNALMIPLTGCVLFTLLAILFHPYIEQLTKVNSFFAVSASCICLLFVLNDVILYLLRNKGRHFLFAGYSLIRTLVEAGATLVLVIGLGYNWTGRLGGNLAGLLVAGIIILSILYKWRLLRGALHKKLITATVVAGLPFIPERLAIFTLGYSDRFFIDHYSSTADVGYYSAGAQLATIVNLSILTLNHTFYPSIFKELSASAVDFTRIRKIIGQFIGISALITLAVIVSIPLFFEYFIGAKFQPGKEYAVFLAIGLFAWSIYNVFLAFLLNLKKNRLIMRISLAGMVLSIAGNYFNVQHFGALGATYTSILVYSFMAIVTIYFVNKFYKLRRIIE